MTSTHTSRHASPSLRAAVAIQAAAITWWHSQGDRGQATAEYALVILGAAAMALLVVSWAASSGKVTTLMNKVVDAVSSRVA